MYTIKLTPERMKLIKDAIDYAIADLKENLYLDGDDPEEKSQRDLIFRLRVAFNELAACKED